MEVSAHHPNFFCMHRVQVLRLSKEIKETRSVAQVYAQSMGRWNETLVTCCVLGITSGVWALESSIPSQVPGLDIKNAHQLTDRIYRGQRPVIKKVPARGESDEERALRLKDIQSLAQFLSPTVQPEQRFTDVLIFKESNQEADRTETEVDREKVELTARGIRVTQIPFKWRNLGPYRETCEQVMEGLRKLKEIDDSTDRMLFFHCTVGEDRTGILAGLYRFLKSADRQNIRGIFHDEMCEKGYEAGDPQKDGAIVGIIRRELTPVFLKLVYRIDRGTLTLNDLSSDHCEVDPAELMSFRDSERYLPTNYTCESSSLAVR